ncbi:MAG: hypothetical protein WAK29_11765 [Terriglobales bacterium]|jgi:hypothetical protein
MTQTKIERSNCRFVVQQGTDGKPFLALELYQDTIPRLKGALLGFDLLGGMRVEQAKKLAEALNEHVLDIFLTVSSET